MSKEAQTQSTEPGSSTPASSQAKPKRTRGPNKPKKPDVTITVKTEAHLSGAQISKLLAAYVEGMLDAETASGMELQIQVEGTEWTAVGGDEKRFPRVRFATKGMR